MAAPETCSCFSSPRKFLVLDRELGMDDHFAEVSIWICRICSQSWLQYFYEMEAFTASGRWYLGAIPSEQATRLRVAEAKASLEELSWYFYGGSYYGGRSGKTSGRIDL